MAQKIITSFFLILVFLIIHSSFTDGVSIKICWSFVLSSITPQTEAEEIIRLLSLVVFCMFNPSDKSMQSRRTQHSPFSCIKCWRRGVREQNKGLLVKLFCIPLQFNPSSVLPPSDRPKSFFPLEVCRKEAFKGDS